MYKATKKTDTNVKKNSCSKTIIAGTSLSFACAPGLPVAGFQLVVKHPNANYEHFDNIVMSE